MSALPINFLPVAEAELSEAEAWWSENRPENPDAIGYAVARSLLLLREFPSIGTMVRNTRAKNVRRLPLKDAPYTLYYRVHADRVDILHLWHTRRGPRPRV